MIWQDTLSFANVTRGVEDPEPKGTEAKGAVLASAKAVAQLARCIPAIAANERTCTTWPLRQGCSLKSTGTLWAF